MGPVEEKERQSDHGKNQETGLQAARTAGQPRRAMELRRQKMPGHGFSVVAGVGSAEQGKREEVERRVKPDGEPEVAGPRDRKTEQQADERNRQGVRESFHRFREVVERPEPGRQEDGCRPEPESVAQSAKGVASEEKLL